MLRSTSRTRPALLAGVLLACASTPAAAQEKGGALEFSAAYTADLTGMVGGGRPHAGRYLDNLDVTVDLDLGQAAGWSGATLHGALLNNSGGTPNDVAGTLQGIDNIEVAKPRLRLFELWLQQSFADDRVTALAGLYDLNSEFYANESAGLLIAPSFGIGSELAATGPNGPSIFPSTALAFRVNVALGEGGYARAAVVNAKSGVLGDPGGVDFSFGDGVLAIAEAGIEGPTRLGVGTWGYSRRQDDIRDLDPAGAPFRRRARGAYVLGEQHLFGGDDGPQATAFGRAGFSDAHTTPFKGGWQAGVLIARPLAGRPDSAISFGVQQGLLSRAFRANLRDTGIDAGHAETGFEITYSDKLSRRITVQPDLQWIHHAGGDRQAKGRLVAALRLTVDLWPAPSE